LSGVVKIDSHLLVPLTSLLLGITCVVCGLAAAWVLKQMKYWRIIIFIGIGMSLAQYGMGMVGLIPLASLIAGLTGILLAIIINYQQIHFKSVRSIPKLSTLYSGYGLLILLMTIIYLTKPVYSFLSSVSWFLPLPGTVTSAGFTVPAGSSQVFRLLIHPGTIMLFTILVSFIILSTQGVAKIGQIKMALKSTWISAAPASLGIISTMGLSSIMDQTGMTFLLAQGLSFLMGNLFPIVSPLIGILGAFATGSNNNSNILFGPMQKNIAELLSINPRMIIAAQTTGGSIGSMLAPAKIIVGCSTVGLKGKEGDILRTTLGVGLIIGLLIGIIVYISI
jgi:lactate permease